MLHLCITDTDLHNPMGVLRPTLQLTVIQTLDWSIYISTWCYVYGLHWYFSVWEEGNPDNLLATITGDNLGQTWVFGFQVHYQGKERLSPTQRLAVASNLKLLSPIFIYARFQGNSTTNKLFSENGTFGLCLLLGRLNTDPEDKCLCRFLFASSRNWRKPALFYKVGRWMAEAFPEPLANIPKSMSVSICLVLPNILILEVIQSVLSRFELHLFFFYKWETCLSDLWNWGTLIVWT